jgi:4-oxalocrotonate tautomerase
VAGSHSHHFLCSNYPKTCGKQLASEIVKKVTEIAVCEEKSVSVAFEEVKPDDWAENVYRPDIIDNKENLIITPGYNPFK